jgi:hypothetical protein
MLGQIKLFEKIKANAFAVQSRSSFLTEEPVGFAGTRTRCHTALAKSRIIQANSALSPKSNIQSHLSTSAVGVWTLRGNLSELVVRRRALPLL